MYIYLYTGPQLRLRKARPQRAEVVRKCSVTLKTEYIYICSGGRMKGGPPGIEIYTPLVL